MNEGIKSEKVRAEAKAAERLIKNAQEMKRERQRRNAHLLTIGLAVVVLIYLSNR
jgi:hydroxylamine reductase (hybrid-cluster protein)